jgi:DNA-binding transcriptional LysR family regulator
MSSSSKASTNRGPAIELRHIRYFLAVAEELHFGRAAQHLRLAQPGLSQQISALEGLIGARLFHRNRRRVELTAAGEAFMPEARKIFVQAERAVLVAQQAARGELGRIKIGYVASAAYTGALRAIVSGFRKSHPDVELGLIEMEMRMQLDEMSEARLDIAFIRPPVRLPSEMAAFRILDEPVALAVPSEHPLAGKKRVALAQFSEEIFITPHHEQGVSFYEHTTQACRAAGFTPRMGPQGRDFVTIASMVSVGLGVALVPMSLQRIQLPGVVCKSISDVAITAELSIAYRTNEGSPSTLAFIEHARKLVR